MKLQMKIALLFLPIGIFLMACTQSPETTTETKTIIVTASAYNSLPSQTHDDHPTTAAWGDELKPGMKCIAVSRDLIAMGLKHNTEVTIEGLSGVYLVLDKMHGKWSKKIDIYMGLDKEAALNWRKKKVKITWLANK